MIMINGNWEQVKTYQIFLEENDQYDEYIEQFDFI